MNRLGRLLFIAALTVLFTVMWRVLLCCWSTGSRLSSRCALPDPFTALPTERSGGFDQVGQRRPTLLVGGLPCSPNSRQQMTNT